MTPGQSQNPTVSSNQKLKEGFKPFGGIIYGILAFLTSFIVVTGYFIYKSNEAIEGEFDLEELFPEPHFIGFPFYNSHSVDTPIEIGGAGTSSSQTVVDSYFEWFNQFAAEAGASTLNTLTFNAIPAIILFVVGYVLASRVTSSLSVEGNAAAGASVAAGYLPLFVLGATLFQYEESGVTAGPEIGFSLLFFGALFTIGFGGLGGYVYGKRHTESSAEPNVPT